MLPNTHGEILKLEIKSSKAFENWQTMINQHSKFLMFFAKFEMDEMNHFLLRQWCWGFSRHRSWGQINVFRTVNYRWWCLEFSRQFDKNPSGLGIPITSLRIEWRVKTCRRSSVVDNTYVRNVCIIHKTFAFDFALC